VQYRLSDAKAWGREKLVGQWTTMVTPFTPQDDLDEAGLSHNIEHVLRLGTRGMGFSWNMGEFWSLTQSERLHLMEAVPRLVRGRALTAFQVSHTSAKEVVAMSRKAEELGFDLVILAAPYIMARTEESVLDFTRRVAGEIGIGIAFYNSPQFGITLSARALGKIADLPNVVAIKEASFNLQTSIDTHLQSGQKAVISAPDEEIFFFEEYYGFHQQVMLANTSDWRFDTADSHHYVPFIDLATAGRLEEAKRLYPKIWPVKELSRRWWGRLVGRTGGALPVQMVKYWGELLGMRGGHVRPPLLPLTADEAEELRRDVSRLLPVKGPTPASGG
jgi:4-hydroxy-tetrahydrodipicolinate synthase